MRTTLNQRGFTLIEIIMVILLVAILSAVAIPQFLDFRTEARNAATSSALGALRTGIATQYAQSILRCNVTPGTWPTAAQITANDITTGGPCTAAQVPAAERQFVADSQLPTNPWSVDPTVAAARAVTQCAGNACLAAGGATHKQNACATGAARAANTGTGWCYDPAAGKIWADSNRSTSANEYEL